MQKNKLYGNRNMSIRGLLFAFVAILTLASQVSAEPGTTLALRDGVVVDAARSIAYVMHPQGGIQAIDLQQGTALWRSTEGERPLGLMGDLLVAQARPGEDGDLRIVALDVRQKGIRSSEADLPMPAGVRAEVADSLKHAFQITASPSRDRILLSWQAQEFAGLPGREADERENERDADSGDRRPRVVRKAFGRGEQDSLHGTALFDPRSGSLSPVTAEAKAAGPRAGAVSLPSAGPERLFASADGRHVLASRRVEGDTSYTWKISDAATGAVLGSFRSDVSMAPFTVVGTRLFYVALPGLRLEGSKMVEEPLRLRALDIATGSELWSRDIRDTAFRGPFPQ
jgi:hypothetical protein